MFMSPPWVWVGREQLQQRQREPGYGWMLVMFGVRTCVVLSCVAESRTNRPVPVLC